MAVTRKNAAAVALGRKGGRKGGPARAAKLTPEQRSESARKAVQARWAKAREGREHIVKAANVAAKKSNRFRKQADEAAPTSTAINASDQTLLALLRRLKETDDRTEVRELSDRLERVIFHKQFEHA